MLVIVYFLNLHACNSLFPQLRCNKFPFLLNFPVHQKKTKQKKQKKHAYSNILNMPPIEKKESLQRKTLIFFIFLLNTEILGND